MSYIIKPRRGLKKDLPVLDEHELAFTTDTKEIYVGTSSGNQVIGAGAGAGAGADDSYVDINYADLVVLRNSNNLKPGALYRITDYETTTVQAESRSAGHLFDIIVQALDEKTLSENAFAVNSSRDTDGYFNGMRLGAWKLKYTLDNDRLKYYWADPVSGKGVIYRMIDEFENDLPYDFKNIQFKRYKINEYPSNIDLVGKYYAVKDMEHNEVYPLGVVIDELDFIWAYTFTTKIAGDESYVESTTVSKHIGINEASKTLYCSKNIFGYKNLYMSDLLDGHYSYILGNNVIYSKTWLIDEASPWHIQLPSSNTIGYGFSSNTIDDYFVENTIGNKFSSNMIGYGFSNNTIGDTFSENVIGDNFIKNTIGGSFVQNTTAPNFESNKIGNSFESNTTGSYFSGNVIGSDFNGNTIGDEFGGNIIGGSFSNNMIGYGFSSNTIGGNFYMNTIGDAFGDNTIGDNFYTNTIPDYFNNNIVEPNVQYIQFSVVGTPYEKITYLYLKNGLSGDSEHNLLDLYYSDLYNRNYATTFEVIANDYIVSSWEETPLTRSGKHKTRYDQYWSGDDSGGGEIPM